MLERVDLLTECWQHRKTNTTFIFDYEWLRREYCLESYFAAWTIPVRNVTGWEQGSCMARQCFRIYTRGLISPAIQRPVVEKWALLSHTEKLPGLDFWPLLAGKCCSFMSFCETTGSIDNNQRLSTPSEKFVRCNLSVALFRKTKFFIRFETSRFSPKINAVFLLKWNNSCVLSMTLKFIVWQSYWMTVI